MGKDTCKQERKSSFNRQHGPGGGSKRSTVASKEKQKTA